MNRTYEVVDRLAGKIGYDVETCGSAREAMQALMRRPADLAMVDLRMPDVNGLDLLRQIRATTPSCEVILMTGFAAVDSAVEAVKLGALDYLTKPFDFDRLRQLLSEIRDELVRRAHSVALESQVARQLEFCGMIGRSPAMQDVFSLIQRLAPHAKVVLISGETGTGKELAARAFHQPGPRRAQAVSSPSTAPRSSTRCSRASCSATCAARSPAPTEAKAGPLRGRAGRHAVPRRNRRAADARSGEAAPRARERGSAAGRLARSRSKVDVR